MNPEELLNPEDSTPTPEETPSDTPKTFTEEDVKKMVQSESDRAVTKALQTAKEKWEADFLKKQEEEKKRKSLPAADRKTIELQEKEQALENKLAELARKELHYEAKDVMAEEGLPVEFAQYLLAENLETTQERITEFKNLWEDAIARATDEQLRQTTPKSAVKPASEVSYEQFVQMDAGERGDFYDRNQALYQQYSKRLRGQ